MFRILLADDEGIMLESISHIIRESFGNVCEIVCVKTGRAVIEQAETFHPDIAFVDIQMPGLNGIQAIKEIRKFNTSIVFIIITAYDKFSYAQEAVNLGVMEFITKPVNKKRFLDVCQRAMRQVEEGRKRLSDDLEIREKLEIVVPMLESGFIYNALWEDAGSSKNEYAKMLELQSRWGFIMVLEFGDSIEETKMTNPIGVSVKLNKSYTLFREIIKGYFDCVIGSVMGNKLVIFVPVKNERTSYEERVSLIAVARNMIGKLENRTDIVCRAGIGSVKDLEILRLSYKEALKALSESDSHVMHIMDIPAAEDTDTDGRAELERSRLQRSEVYQAKAFIDENYEKELSLDEVSEMVGISPYYFSKLFKKEMGETFIEYLTRTRIKNARRLLGDHRYSIKEVCSMSGYSDPNYFSRIFKKYEGMTPSEYREKDES